ncbi:MAG: helix-turn-helix transcriptional regulator, partial [Jatrophihabitantaceae bacterium]
AAVDSGGGADAQILLASLLTMAGQVKQAQRVLDALAAAGLTPEQRSEFASVYAFVLTQGGHLSEPAAMISRLAAESAQNVEQLQGIHAQALIFDGRLTEGLGLAAQLFDQSGDDVARALAAMALIAGSHFQGSTSTSDPVSGQAEPIAERVRDRLPYVIGTLAVARSIGLTGAGRFSESETIAKALYDRGLAEDDSWMGPRGASALGVLALARGQVRTAARYLRIAVASLNDFDRLFLRYNLALLAQGVAYCGAVEQAERALRSGGGAPVFRLFEDDWALAEAAVLAARGHVDEAIEQAVRTAEAAEQNGSWGLASIAAHAAVRYGGGPTSANLLRRCAERVQGPMFAVMSDHGSARAAADGVRLDAVCARFEDLGAMLLAAEAAYAAGTAHRGSGDATSAAASMARGITLHARCEGARIPWIAPQGGGLLTAREQQVAVLAAAGRTDAQIAAELAISIRTVSTHLSNAYGKLGVSTRRELPQAL